MSMTTIADRDTIRKLIGGRSTNLVSDAQIDSVIEFSDSFVRTKTNKLDWDTADPGYDSVQKASEYFASAELLSRWEDTEEDSKVHWDRAMAIIGCVVTNLATATGGEQQAGNVFTMVSGEYLTSPLNPSVMPRRPGKPGAVYEGGERLYRLGY